MATLTILAAAPPPIQTPTALEETSAEPPTEAEAEAEAEPEPQPESEIPAAPTLPTLPGEESAAEPPATPDPLATEPGAELNDPPPPAVVDPVESAPIFEAEASEKKDYVRVKRPNWNGTGLFIGAGLALSAGISFQLGDRIVCGGCGPGISERIFFSHAFLMAALGGLQRGRANAFDDAALKRRPRDTHKALIAGATLLGVGLAAGVINEGLWWRGWTAGDGPFGSTDTWGEDYIKKLAISRTILDVSVMMSSAGAGILTWRARYKRDSAAYRNARVVSVSPTASANFTGLTVKGSF